MQVEQSAHRVLGHAELFGEFDLGPAADLPGQRLARGQVGTIVEQLDDKTLLVEFSEDQNRAYATMPAR